MLSSLKNNNLRKKNNRNCHSQGIEERELENIIFNIFIPKGVAGLCEKKL